MGSVQKPAKICSQILSNLNNVVLAPDEFLEHVLCAALSKQHVLIEDVPGTGKTLTAQSVADIFGLEFNRIQFTPDLLPSDVIGTNIFDEDDGTFEFSEGPVFANIIVADEINRAPAKTQSALLEAMSEKQVSVGGETHQLPSPFIVIATQNPIEQRGTFELPMAQQDRFAVKTTIGYPDKSEEKQLIHSRGDRSSHRPAADQMLQPTMLSSLQNECENIHVAQEISQYVVDILHALRSDSRVSVGPSPRAGQQIFELSRALALIAGREYVVPADVTQLVQPTFTHRIVLADGAQAKQIERPAVIKDIRESVPVPTMGD